MKCTKCKDGEIEVHACCECETVYKQDVDGNWKEGKLNVINCTETYGECNKCKSKFSIDVNKFQKEGIIEIMYEILDLL